MVMKVHTVKMPVGFGVCALNGKGRPLSVMAHLRQIIVDMNSEENFLTHSLLTAIARL